MADRIQPVITGGESGGALFDATDAVLLIPEAFHDSPQFNGLLLVVGFVALLVLLVLGD